MTTKTNRREFEEWVETIGYSNAQFRDSDEYISDAVQVAWEAWQAARERLTEQRDRLAAAIRKHKETLPFAPQPCDKKLYEALESLTTNEQ